MSDAVGVGSIWPASGYRRGSSNVGPIFNNLKTAYNAKGGCQTANGHLVGDSRPQKLWPFFPAAAKRFPVPLARLLASFCPSEAYACATIQPPAVFVKAFSTVDITAVLLPQPVTMRLLVLALQEAICFLATSSFRHYWYTNKRTS